MDKVKFDFDKLERLAEEIHQFVNQERKNIEDLGDLERRVAELEKNKSLEQPQTKYPTYQNVPSCPANPNHHHHGVQCCYNNPCYWS